MPYIGVRQEGGILCSERLSWDHSASEDFERFRLRNLFPEDAAVIREGGDDFLCEYAHRVKDFARFTRSIGDVQLKDPDCARKFNGLQSKVNPAAHQRPPEPIRSRLLPPAVSTFTRPLTCVHVCVATNLRRSS